VLLDELEVVGLHYLPDVDLLGVVIGDISESVVPRNDANFRDIVEFVFTAAAALLSLDAVTLSAPAGLLIGLVGIVSRFGLIRTQSARGKEVVHN